MTKKRKTKKKEQGASVFQNSPFASLKGAVRVSAASQLKAAHAAGSGRETEDAEELFLRSVRGTRRMAGDSSEVAEQQPESAAKVPGPDYEDNGDRELFLSALGTIGTAGFRESPQEEEEETPARSPSSRMRSLKRGAIRISGELDLHGFQKDEAIRRLALFISDAYARKQQAVLVITGKGTNSPEGPVLPGAVDTWLRQQGRSMVAEFHTAPRDKGGSGAFVVFLKKRPG